MQNIGRIFDECHARCATPRADVNGADGLRETDLLKPKNTRDRAALKSGKDVAKVLRVRESCLLSRSKLYRTCKKA